jgi:BBSome-interacting protein 1
MAISGSQIREVLPKQGQLYDEDLPLMVLCKPKLLPLKSVTLEKLEKMQRDAEELVRQQEAATRLQQTDAFGHVITESGKTLDNEALTDDEPNRLVL